MSKHIFFAPGMFSGPEPYEPCSKRLQEEGYTTRLGITRTTNTKSPGAPSIADNVARYRDDISQFVEEAGSSEVVVVLHSAAGHFCSGALKDLGVQQRKASGKTGGISHLVFIAAIIAEEGKSKETQNPAVSADNLAASGLMHIADGQIFVNNAAEVFYQDLPQSDAQEWAKKVSPEPREGWDSLVPYVGWRDIPSTYVVCEKDMLIPASVQEIFCKTSGSKVVRIDAGHFPQLSRPNEVVEIIKGAAAGC